MTRIILLARITQTSFLSFLRQVTHSVSRLGGPRSSLTPCIQNGAGHLFQPLTHVLSFLNKSPNKPQALLNSVARHRLPWVSLLASPHPCSWLFPTDSRAPPRREGSLLRLRKLRKPPRFKRFGKLKGPQGPQGAVMWVFKHFLISCICVCHSTR